MGNTEKMKTSLVLLKIKITTNISDILPFQLVKIQKVVTQSWGEFGDRTTGVDGEKVFLKGQWTMKTEMCTGQAL